MNREIKFRAWNGRELCYDVTIFNGRFIDCSEASDDIFYKWPDPSEQVSIMQSTGLFDFKGSEIWEGDIVETGYINENGNFRYRAAVYWIDKDCCFGLKTDASSIDYTRLTVKTVDGNKSVYSHISNLGNIFENLELLDQSQNQ